MEAIYRIKVEVIGEQTHEVRPEALQGIECTDFVILGFKGDESMDTAIQASGMQIAAGIEANDDLRQLARLGLMMYDKRQLARAVKAGSEADGPDATSAEDEEEDG